jgi:hypothetical protein
MEESKNAILAKYGIYRKYKLAISETSNVPPPTNKPTTIDTKPIKLAALVSSVLVCCEILSHLLFISSKTKSSLSSTDFLGSPSSEPV